MCPPRFTLDKARYLRPNQIKEVTEQEIDEETGEPVKRKEVKKNPISHEQVLELEYKALVSEGKALYYRNEFYRAIESFTKALNNNKEDLGILIDRANCYVQIGNPKAALLDINVVLGTKPDDTRAILAKAEAFFSMGEFEFALVFFEKGLAIRRDLVAFRNGISKSKNAILDSIRGSKPFQPNPNFAISRPRRALVDVKKTTPMETDPDAAEARAGPLLPETVVPLSMTTEERSTYLGEISLDYDYLVELREEILEGSDDGVGSKEDAVILRIVNDALIYLNQRAQFWSQQGATTKEVQSRDGERPTSARRVKVTRVQKDTDSRPGTARRNRGPEREKPQKAYEMSKIQMYEAKYGARK